MMTEKRFIGSYAGFYDKYKENRLLWSEWEEITIILNNLNEKSVERSKALSKLQKENNQLKKELTKLKEWEKYIGDIKREELDAVFKMSIYEIADGFKYYQERIKELENEMKE